MTMAQANYLTPVGWFIVGGFLALMLALWLCVEISFHRQEKRSRKRVTIERQPW